jgi:hypothetical protein
MEREAMMVTTTVRVSRRVWVMLRALAEARAIEEGGRASVSGVIAAMAEEKSAQAERDRG